MNQYEYWLYAYQQCLPADRYLIRMVDSKKEKKTQPRTYSYQQLWKSRKYLWTMNHNGYHIYGRPDDYRFILVDDISKDKLGLLMELKPSIAMETSFNNFQAFLNLKRIPPTREYAAEICKELCELLGGDFGSAEPDHVGRLPGFFNLKPEYKNNSRWYPLVKLHHALDQFSCFTPQSRQATGAVDTHCNKSFVTPKTNDRSAQDFAIAMKMLEGKYNEKEIYDELIKGDKGRERGEKYVIRTIKNAKEKIRMRNILP